MYKISQFSKISGLTVKALRYYDDEDILKPSLRSDENQYRFYSNEDLKIAEFIRFLRSLDFSIMEIKDVLENVHSDDDLTFILQEKIKHIEDNISREEEIMKKLKNNLTTIDDYQSVVDYEVDVIEIEETFVASIRFIGKYSDLDIQLPKLYKAVKNLKSGNHFNCYYDDECVENADIELCIPIKKSIEDNTIVCKTLPRIKALRTIHYGPYENLYLAYRALFDTINKNEINVLTPSREIYIKGPGMIFKGNPANYVTEIIIPFESIKKE